MDLNAFLASRRDRWQRLADLLDRAEAGGLEQLPPEQVDELYRLYRLASSDLNLAQTRTGNPAVLDALEAMVGRAYAVLAVPQRARPLSGWWRVMRHDFPAALRQQWALLVLAAATLIAGMLFGWLATALDPDLTVVFLPAEHLSQTPAERVAELEELERGSGGQLTRIGGLGGHAVFSSFLFTHNIRVTVLGFALGLTFGVGTLVVLFFNGAMIGCLAQRYFADGVGEFFVAWVGPHGSIELPCILFGCTAGLMLARAQWRGAGGPLWHRLRPVRPQLLSLLIGTATLLVFAGVIEGGFSQVNEPTLPYPFKIAVAAALFLALLAYVFVLPVRGRPPTEAADS